MPKTTVSARKIKHGGKTRYRVCIPTSLQAEHDCSRRFFANKVEADKFADLLNQSRQGWSSRLLCLSDNAQGRLVRCLERVNNDVDLIEQALDALFKRKAAKTKPLTEAVTEFLADKKTAGKSDAYLGLLKCDLNKFAAGREERSVDSITHEELTEYINGNGWRDATRDCKIRVFNCFFEWARKRGYIAENPVAIVERPTVTRGPVKILSPDEVKRLLRTAAKLDPEMVSYFAIGIFAGIRPSELSRLKPENFRNGSGCIVMDGPQTKTRQRRVIDVHPTLAAWLKSYPSLQWSQAPRRFNAIHTAAAVSWHHDVMRHSYVSHALMLDGAGVGKVGLMAGHSEAILLKHYRETVTPEDAKRFWDLTPEVVLKPEPVPANVTAMPAAA